MCSNAPRNQIHSYTQRGLYTYIHVYNYIIYNGAYNGARNIIVRCWMKQFMRTHTYPYRPLQTHTDPYIPIQTHTDQYRPIQIGAWVWSSYYVDVHGQGHMMTRVMCVMKGMQPDYM